MIMNSAREQINLQGFEQILMLRVISGQIFFVISPVFRDQFRFLRSVSNKARFIMVVPTPISRLGLYSFPQHGP